MFSDHSLATDSVFAEVQFVSCRNVLIYFNRALQDRALGLFRESLCRQRFSRHRLEGVAAILRPDDGAFVPFVREDRIYQKSGADVNARQRTDTADIRRGCHRRIGRRRAGALPSCCPRCPANAPAAVFVVLHLPRDRPSLLVDVFSQKCALAVREAEDKEPVMPGTVYFAPPNYHLLVDAGPQLALSADDLVQSLAPLDRCAVRFRGARCMRASARHHSQRRERGWRRGTRRRARCGRN